MSEEKKKLPKRIPCPKCFFYHGKRSEKLYIKSYGECRVCAYDKNIRKKKKK